MFESYPLTPKDTPDGIILFESDQDTAHGNIPEDDRQRQGRQQEEHIQLPVLNDIDQRIV